MGTHRHNDFHGHGHGLRRQREHQHQLKHTALQPTTTALPVLTRPFQATRLASLSGTAWNSERSVATLHRRPETCNDTSRRTLTVKCTTVKTGASRLKKSRLVRRHRWYECPFSTAGRT